MEEARRKFTWLDVVIGFVLGVLFMGIALLVLTGCTIRDGYLVAEAPAIAVSGEYYSPGYGSYGYDPYRYPGYRSVSRPFVAYHRHYPVPAVIHRTRVVHHHHHPAYRERAVVHDNRFRRPVSPPVYRRSVGTVQAPRNTPPRRRPIRVRRF